VDHPCIDCFRAILYNGGVEATTIQTSIGKTPLHGSTARNVSLVTLWELLCFNRDCITIQDVHGRTALDFFYSTTRTDSVQRQSSSSWQSCSKGSK
jgi:hypothetical protein